MTLRFDNSVDAFARWYLSRLLLGDARAVLDALEGELRVRVRREVPHGARCRAEVVLARGDGFVLDLAGASLTEALWRTGQQLRQRLRSTAGLRA